jgi:diguanylate cyclase (GGDEF)-like protein
MTDRISADGLPLALLADDREERTRWLARLLEEAGYAVLREHTARHTLERGRAAQPDLIIIGGDLPDMPGIELCRVLRGDARITRGTPIFLAPPEPGTREQRLAALREGAWEFITPPHDPDEIVLKANAYVRSKLESDRTRLEGLLDPQTGLYNHHGLARRARELASQAFREHSALACVALILDLEGGRVTGTQDAMETVAHGVHMLQATARRSDVVGRLGPAEFAVLAPGTDASGARRLAERLAGSMQVAMAPSASPGLGVPVRFGYEAVANVGYAPIEPTELLVRASAAVRTGKAEVGGWIRRFDAAAATTR